MIIDLNGKPVEVPDAVTITEFIESRTGSGRGSAVVVDGEVVPRSTWSAVTLHAGQTVELITAVQGG